MISQFGDLGIGILAAKRSDQNLAMSLTVILFLFFDLFLEAVQVGKIMIEIPDIFFLV